MTPIVYVTPSGRALAQQPQAALLAMAEHMAQVSLRRPLPPMTDLRGR